jgi:SAM-dependent methyltransferase
MGLIIKTEISLKPDAVFKAITDELFLALHRLGLEFGARKTGLITQGNREVGRVITWQPSKRVLLVLHSADWANGDTRMDFRFQSTKRGTRITIGHSGLDPLLSDQNDSLGWFTDQVIAPLVKASSPSMFGDWITDRRARRPTGALARRGYRDPTHHRPNFGAILEQLALTPKDHLLEIGCGGGALLHDALESGCTAAGIDHSAEMVRLTKTANAKAVEERRLEVKESEADPLPFKDSIFTCAVMTSVLGFLEDPVRVFREVRRVLRPTGRMIVFSTSKEAKGTMAAPEPMASRIHFYEDADLKRMALEAGFDEAHVQRPDLSRFTKGARIPKHDQGSFSTRIGQLLTAKKILN